MCSKAEIIALVHFQAVNPGRFYQIHDQKGRLCFMIKSSFVWVCTCSLIKQQHTVPSNPLKIIGLQSGTVRNTGNTSGGWDVMMH